MRNVDVTEAAAKFNSMLDEVEQGETIAITRDGKAIARLVPEDEINKERVKRAFASIQALRMRTKPVSIDEILAARDEGRE